MRRNLGREMRRLADAAEAELRRHPDAPVGSRIVIDVNSEGVPPDDKFAFAIQWPEGVDRFQVATVLKVVARNLEKHPRAEADGV